MPSLNALGKFKASFDNIANEKNDIASKNLPFNDITLPDTEAPPFELSDTAAPPIDDSSEAGSGVGNIDFSAFLDSLPADDVNPQPVEEFQNEEELQPDDGSPSVDEINGLIDEENLQSKESPPPADEPADETLDDFFKDFETPSEESHPDDTGSPLPETDSAPPDETPAASGDDYSIPDELLSGLSNEIEATPADFPAEDVPTEDFPTDGFPAGGLPTESSPAESEVHADSQNVESHVDLGGERQDGTFTTDSIPDGLPAFEDADVSPEIPDSGGEETSADFNFDTPLPNFELPPVEDTSGADSSGLDSSGLDTSGLDSSLSDFELPETGQIADDQGETPILGDLGSDFASGSIDLDNEADMPDSVPPSADDFALPVLDELFDKGKIGTPVPPAPKKGLFGKKKAEDDKEAESDDIEEIQLSQADMDSILQTLSGYPLNLRIACEELIAEQVILPQQLSKLIRYLVRGAPVKDTAALAGEILNKTIVIPKSFQKGTGEEWEAEKSSFAYIFVHNFLPVLRLFVVIAALAASVVYLGYRFIYLPLMAESLYKRGYERIPAGEYQRANELFHEAFTTHRKKKWFYLYAESFRDQRRYMLAEGKYDELLRYYPRDKKGVLDYASMETNYLLNYDKANRILQEELIDYAPNDYDGLLAAGDNFLAWADSDPSRFYDKYENARFSYARILQLYGWQVPVAERMMKYFIRTDDLKETLNMRVWFENDTRRKLSPEALAELGGYLLDKQLEKVKGVPNPYVESIESVRSMLLQAVREEPTLPEPHYHLARYYKNLNNTYEERLVLENAIRAFDLAKSESVRRRLMRVDTQYRYANLLINNKEFFTADDQLVRGIELYEDFLSRNLVSPSPQLGQLYAARGDLEYFVKSGNMQAALRNYNIAERYGWAPPEIQYRMGAAYYQLEDWGNALDYLFKSSAELPLNRRLLFALGNTAYKRGDYYASQGYYNRLLDILENQRLRLPVLLPNDRPEFLELGERLMMARNNAGVVNEALAGLTGNRDYRSRALYLYAESARAWDSITRDPNTMTRMHLTDSPGAPGINLGFLNAGNAMRPVSDFKPEIFIRIDKDVLEPSLWEELAPFGGLVN